MLCSEGVYNKAHMAVLEIIKAPSSGYYLLVICYIFIINRVNLLEDYYISLQTISLPKTGKALIDEGNTASAATSSSTSTECRWHPETLG